VLFIFKMDIFDFFDIQWQYCCAMTVSHFVDWFVIFGSPIPHSFGSDAHIDFIYVTCHTVLLPLIFAAFRVLDLIRSYDRSKCIIRLTEYELSKFWESRKVNILIPSMTRIIWPDATQIKECAEILREVQSETGSD
jgi:hypothetical protein